jgi:hypothetical protein
MIPIKREITYNVIHKNSAVNNKCNAVFTFIDILKNIIKNKIKIKFISPNVINYKKIKINLKVVTY